MTLLPVVGRELLVAARRPGTYWLRFATAALGIVIFFVVLAGANVSPSEIGRQSFIGLSVATLGFCLLSGVFLTADCLSSEKREGTIGLLFLTDLKGYDVVLGKLAAGSINAVFGLLAVLPVLGLPILLGGVHGTEFLLVVVVFLATLFLSLSIGLFISCFCFDSQKAIGGTFLAVVVFTGVFPALWWLQSFCLKTRHFDFLLWPSPACALNEALAATSPFGRGSAQYWHAIECILALAAASVLWPCLTLSRTWQTTGDARSTPARKVDGGRRSSPGRRDVLSEENPFLQLASRRRLSGVSTLAFWGLLLLFFGFLVMQAFEPSSTTPPYPFIVSFFVAFGLHQVVKVFVATESSRRFHEDRQSGALELLLCTPLPVRSILDGEMAGLLLRLGNLLRMLCLVNLALEAAMVLMHDKLDMDNETAWIFSEMFGGGLLVLAFDFQALCWVGMWRGLTAKKHAHAVMGTIVQVLLPSWLAIFFVVIMQPAFFNTIEGGMISIAFWFGCGAIVNVYSIHRARANLATRFRSTVASRYGANSG